jgi:nucleotidyltransferase substrate binding protein (TIGR01987 family)
MEELKIKRDIVLQALVTFEEAIRIMENPKYEEIYKTTRDSAIQRFEYTIDSFWKFLKIYMQQRLNIFVKIDSPRAILREALNAQIITNEEFEQLIEGVADRNLTSHSYKEEVANMLAFHLPTYYVMMYDIVSRVTI